MSHTMDRMRQWPDNGVAYGGDYNPEQWPRSTWDEDVELMRRAGVTFVTLGVFSWSWLEPKAGVYEFEWLDTIMDKLAAAGIAVDLATATAAPPVWLSQEHPDTLPVDREGHVLGQGSRQAWCPSSTTFRDHAVALTAQMARRYHDHPALAMWHVSNEYGCHNVPCYCDRCAAAFRTWLQARHGTLEALNDSWGTAFWSQRYTDWEHVLPPRATPTINNPTQVLDYTRFQSDQLLAQHDAELAVLRELSPGVPVTTNFMTMTGFRHLDYHSWASHVDVVSTDHYRVDALPDPTAELSLSAAITRGVAGGRPWMLMEHSTSAVNWQPVNPAKPAGQLLRDSLSHVAHGADTVGYFQWRASRAGAEKYHSAMLPHAGPDTRRFAEVSRLGEILGRMPDLLGSRVEARVAVLWDYEAQWAAGGPALPSEALDYPDAALAVHRALRDLHVTADVVHPGADLEGYDVVVVPTLYLVRDEHATAVADAAARGAHVVVTYFSGIVDEHDHIRLGGYPGAFRDLLGVRCQEFSPLRVGEQVRLDDGTTGTVWSEDLDAVDCEVLARYADGPLDGGPAMTRRRVAGGGSATYVSTLLDDEGWRRLLDGLRAEAGIDRVAEASPGVELVRRSGDRGSWLFAINHGDTTAEVTASGHDVVADAPVEGRVALAAGGVAVIRETGTERD